MQARGRAGGIGAGGAITISLAGSQVTADGVGSAGILAQSEGSVASGQITISLDRTSLVRGGLPDPNFPGSQDPSQRDVAAIRLLGGTGNQIINAGTIVSNLAGSGYAILADTPQGNNTVTNTGTISGDILFSGSAGSVVDNRQGGVVNAPTTINVAGGVLRNAGTLHVGGIGTIGTTTLTGDLAQSPTGQIRIDVDGVRGQADLLRITGQAALGGSVVVNPISLRKGVSGPVITADGGFTTLPEVRLSLATSIFSQTPVTLGNALAIRTDADFGAGRLPAQRSLAGYLQRVFDDGAPGFDQAFLVLAGLPTDRAYLDALGRLSGQEIAAVASSRYEASQNFARDAFNCPAIPASGTVPGKASCVWGRTSGTVIDHDGSGGFPAYRWSAVSVRIGGQTEIHPNLFLAGSLGYETGRLNDGNNPARASTDTGLAMVGLRYQAGPWTLDGVFDIAAGGVNIRRTVISVGRTTADTDALNAGLHLRAAYTAPLGNAYVEPALELDANYVRIGGYTETGAAPFNLRVRSLNDGVFAATPGVRVGHRFGLGTSVANVYASAGVSFLAGNSFDVDARFDAVPGREGGFRNTFANDTVVGRFTAGVDIATVGGIDFRLQYQGRRSANQTEHGGQARLAYRF